MKATGIVRRIDDLGRVVIPKEIRRTMRIREGDPLEIYTNAGGEVIFKKYSPMGELSAFANSYAEALTLGTSLPIIICDRERCIAAAGVSKKEVIDKTISDRLETVLNERRSVTFENENYQKALEGCEYDMEVAAPIINAGDICGAVVFLKSEGLEVKDSDQKLCAVAAEFLSKQID